MTPIFVFANKHGLRYKLCVFLNAFVVSAKVGSAITRLLKNNNRTLAWTYAAGIFESADGNSINGHGRDNGQVESLPSPTVNVSAMSELVDVAVERGVWPQVRAPWSIPFSISQSNALSVQLSVLLSVQPSVQVSVLHTCASYVRTRAHG